MRIYIYDEYNESRDTGDLKISTTSVRDFMVVADPSFLTTPKKTQQSILTFAVKTPPFTFVHRPSPPRKGQLMENRGPGRPKKKLREEDWRQKWYDAAESESYSSIGV